MNKPMETKKAKGRPKKTRAEKAVELGKQNSETIEQPNVSESKPEPKAEKPTIKTVNKKEIAEPMVDKIDNLPEENIVENVIPEKHKLGNDMRDLGLTLEDVKEDHVPVEKYFDPLQKPVAKKGYEGGNIKTNPSGDIPSEEQRDFAESVYVGDTPQIGVGNENKTDNPDSDDVFGGGSGYRGGSNNNDIGGGKAPAEPTSPKPPDFGGGGSSISEPPKPVAGEKERRRNAVKTADIILDNYVNIAPIPFKKMAAFNIAKVERMEMNNEINTKMQVMQDGTTIIQYMQRENNKVDVLFEVSEETREGIKAPLVDLLLEKGGELSPAWRLALAVGGHVVSMGGIAIQMLIAKKSAMEQFQQFHADALKSGAYRNSPIYNNQQQPQSQPEQPKSAAEKRREKHGDDEENEKPAMDMSSYIHDDIPETAENDSSVTIEGQPPKEE